MNATLEIEKYRWANLIKGYVAGIDFYPKRINLPSKPLRFAVAFSCYYPCIEGHYFLDSKLITNICTKLIDTFDYEANTWDKRSFNFNASEKEIDNLRNIIINPKDPVAYINIWRWDDVGGPFEYHDLYTVEVFTSIKYFDDLLQKTMTALSENKCKVTILERPSEPETLKWWQITRRFFKKYL